MERLRGDSLAGDIGDVGHHARQPGPHAGPERVSTPVVYSGVLEFQSGSYGFEIPVDFELFEMELTRMLEDFERPYVYALTPRQR